MHELKRMRATLAERRRVQKHCLDPLLSSVRERNPTPPLWGTQARP